MATHSIRMQAASLALLLAAGVTRGEDVFSLLEPEAFVAARTEPESTSPQPTSPPSATAVSESGPEEEEVAATEPARLGAHPIAVAMPSGGGITVTDAVESVPAQLLPIGSATPLTGPMVGPPRELSINDLSRSILGLTVDAAADPALVEQMAMIPETLAIRDVAMDRFGSWDAPVREATQTPPRFGGGIVTFAAPAVYSRPLYFEQPNLERYGHHVACCDRDNLTQSALSAAHFFATVPVLPYKMGANPPDECNYVLGSYRPGSCNPHELLKPQLSVGGVALEGVAVTGLIFLIP